MDAPKSEDMVDTKPSRPELPAPKLKKPVSERPPAPLPDDTGRPELPVSLRPTPNSETSLFESKPATEEKPPIRNAKPIPKKSPPILPKKPDKPKLPGDGKDQPSSPPPLASKKTPPVILRHQNGLDNNPTRRFSTGPISEVNPKAEMKRHSQGSGWSLEYLTYYLLLNHFNFMSAEHFASQRLSLVELSAVRQSKIKKGPVLASSLRGKGLMGVNKLS